MFPRIPSGSGSGNTGPAVLLLLLTVCLLGLWGFPAGRTHGAASALAAPPPTEEGGTIVRLIGVGMVLTSDGGISVYRPDRDRWMSIDESFKLEGRRTKVLPLPVPPEAIREMATWGFILSQAGVCWLYDIEENRWKELPAPGARD